VTAGVVGGPLVDGVLFDVDDTLVDTRGAFAVALAQVARQYLPHLPEERHGEVLAAWRADAGGHYRRYTRGEIGYLEQRHARANELHAMVGGVELDAEGYRAWDAVFEAGFARAWAAHPDAADVVERLFASGVAVGALTNAAVAYQTGKLAKAGLEQVPVLVGVDTLGVGKPDPRVFTEACRLLGTAPERTAYVGDELDVDARAAAEVGLVGVWVDRPGTRRHAIDETDVAAAREAGVQVIASLTELPGLLGLEK
jgi:putative hydrolase of the HAD superfamily